MKIPDKAWKGIAAGLLAILVLVGLYLVVWLRVQDGEAAATYIGKCIQAGVCPSDAQLNAKLQGAAPPTVPTASPRATSSCFPRSNP